MIIMGKYWAVLKAELQEELFYQTNFFFYFIRKIIGFLIQVLLWTVIFKDYETVAGFDYGSMLLYFLTLFFVDLIAGNNIDSSLGNLIRSGDLSRFLLKPFSFIWMMLFRQLGNKVVRIGVVVFFAFALFLAGKINIGFWGVFVFGLLLVNSFFISFLYRFFLGTLSFWLINISSVLWLFRQSASFLGGGWLPVSFFPVWSLKVVKILPFYLSLGFPADFFRGGLASSAIFWGILAQLGWIIALFLAVAVLWRKGEKVYEAVGN